MEPDLPNISPDPSLTATQHRVLALLADGRSLSQAAEACDIHRNTIRNWRRTIPAFARDCDLALREQAAAWHDFSLQFAPRAIEILHHLLHSPDTPQHLQLRAALAILKMATDPHPKPLPVDSTLGSMLSAAQGHQLASRALRAQENEIPRTILHNEPPAETVRRAPEPGRNSACPCGSNLKYKRCCGSVHSSLTNSAAQPCTIGASH